MITAVPSSPKTPPAPQPEPAVSSSCDLSHPRLSNLHASSLALHTCLLRPPTPDDREMAQRRPVAHSKSTVDVLSLGYFKAFREGHRAWTRGKRAQAVGWGAVAFVATAAFAYGGVLVSAPAAAVHYGMQRGLGKRSTWGPRSEDGVHIDMAARDLRALREGLRAFCLGCAGWASTGDVSRSGAQAALTEAREALDVIEAQIRGNKSAKVSCSEFLAKQLRISRSLLEAAERRLLLWDNAPALAAQAMPKPDGFWDRME